MVRDSLTGLTFHDGTLWRTPIAPRVVQLVDFAFGLLYALLAARFVLEYIAAPPVPFVQLVDRYSDAFYAPFNGILHVGHDRGGHPIPWSLPAAMAVYMLLHAAVVSFVKVLARVGER